MYGVIKAFINSHREEFKSPIYEDIFVSLCMATSEIINDNVVVEKIDRAGIVKGVYDNVFCLIFKPMVEINNNLSDALAEQVKYGIKITVTTEQMENLIKEIEQ